MLPLVRSNIDENRFMSVDLPEPLDPIIHTISPGPKLKFRDSNIGFFEFGY